MYWKKGNFGNFYTIRKFVNLRTFFNPENRLADKNQLFPCLPFSWIFIRLVRESCKIKHLEEFSSCEKQRCFNAAPDMIKLKGRYYPNIYDVLPGNLRIATNFPWPWVTFLLLLFMLSRIQTRTSSTEFIFCHIGKYSYLHQHKKSFVFLGSVPASIHHFVRVRVHVCICAWVCGQQIFLATLNNGVQRRML